MIDLKDLRENPEKYRRGAELKGAHVEIPRILDLDRQRVEAQQAFERARVPHGGERDDNRFAAVAPMRKVSGMTSNCP